MTALIRSLTYVAANSKAAGIVLLAGPAGLLMVLAGIELFRGADCIAQDRSSPNGAPALKPAKAASTPLRIEQVKAAPDDSELLKQFVNAQSRDAIGLLPQDPNGAERLLAELRGVVKSLQPRTAAGKRQLAESLAAIDAYGKRIEIARTDLAKLRDQLAANPNQPNLIHRYFDKLAMEVYSLARTDSTAARKLLDESAAFARGIQAKATDKEALRQFEQSSRRLDRLEGAVGSSQELAKLLDKPGAPFQVEAWAHGEPLSPQSLAGKVVLLDFWAVWCSPCVASLPKLDEWHRQWSDQGLVIIGLTQYYNFAWDERAERPVRSDGKVPPDQERAMLARFAQQNGMRHRIALEDKESKLSKHYKVTGIPHTVLIDQTGTVRLVRVGSGLKNARDIEKLLTELLGPARHSPANPRPEAPSQPSKAKPANPASPAIAPKRAAETNAKPNADAKSNAEAKPKSEASS